jgi:DUF1680 family protein
LTGSPEWADELEKSLFNALPAAMKLDGSWWTYYSPLIGERSPSHLQYKDIGLSCCVASGPRGLLLTHKWAAMQDADGAVVINLYVPGSVTVTLAGGERVVIRQETGYPVDGTVRLTLHTRTVAPLTLRLRIPAWSREGRVVVGDESRVTEPGTYFSISRNWSNGDTVIVHLDMRARAVPAPSGAPQFALVRGPLVLALDSRVVAASSQSLRLVADQDGFVDARPVASPHPDIAFVCEAPFIYHKIHIEKLAVSLPMCDYASAGNAWTPENRFRTWLPQPLCMRHPFS